MITHSDLIVDVGHPAVLVGCKGLMAVHTVILVHVLGKLKFGGRKVERRRQYSETVAKIVEKLNFLSPGQV